MSLFRLANGSDVCILSAKDLVTIPVWKNNRIIDYEHAANIQRDVKDPRLLDHGYQIAILTEEDAVGNPIQQRYIIDGQHRHMILKRYFDSATEDFYVIAYQRAFATEGELIEHFNAINNCKPVQPWVDETLILNQYLHALEEAFHNRKTRLIRSGGCHRPHLSADRFRDALRPHIKSLTPSSEGATAFAARVKAWNDRVIAEEGYVASIRAATRRAAFEKGAKLGFVLAYDEKFAWLPEVLKA